MNPGRDAFASATLALLASALVWSGSPTPAAPADAANTVANTPLARTGGFGEPTCLECHLEFDLNPDGGVLELDGLPEAYERGASYRLRVRLSGDGMLKGGFQTAVRFADGKQAGSLVSADGRTTVADSLGTSYVQHSAPGAELTGVDEAAWEFEWTAPVIEGSVRFHVSANSANGDNSPLGDWVFALEREVRPTR